MSRRPTYASFFSGVGGFELGLDAAGWEHVFSCEIDETCRKVYFERFGHEPQGTDINDLRPADIPDADLWVGGVPCQDLSVAGKRAGLAGARSGLFHRFAELVRARRPRHVLLEQVPGLLSSNDGRDMETWVGALAELGYMGACWTADAQHFGVPQRRRRLFTLGGPGDGSLLPVLPVLESRTGNPEEGEEKRPRAAEAPPGGAGGSSREVAAAVVGRDAKGPDSDVTQALVAGAVSHLGGGGADDNDAQRNLLVASSIRSAEGPHGHSWGMRGDGSDNLVPTPPCTEETKGERKVAAPVRTNVYNNSDPGMEAQQLVVFEPGNLTRRCGSAPNENVVPTLGSAKTGDTFPCIAFQPTAGAHSLGIGDKSPTIKVGSGLGIPSAPAVCFQQNSRHEVRLVGGDGDTVGAVAAQAGAQQQNYIASPITSGGHPNSNAPGRCKEDDENLVVFDNGQGDPNAQTSQTSFAVNGQGHQGVVLPTITTDSCDGGRKGWAPQNEADHLVVPAVVGKWSKGAGGPAGDECQNLVAGAVTGSYRKGPGFNGQDVNLVAYIDEYGTHGSSSPNQSPIKMDGKADAVNTKGAGGIMGGVSPTIREHTRPGSNVDYSVAVPCTESTKGEAPKPVSAPMTVRRLTPTECERLMGWPDGHTCTCGVRPDCPRRRIPRWIDPSKVRLGGCGHSACGCECSDGPRYRMCGNGVVAPVVRWIGERLLKAVLEEAVDAADQGMGR
jgi:site-specific DNA-cytosine methylase